MKPTVFYGAPTGFAGMLASPACRSARTWRCASSRPPARRCRPRSASGSSAISASTSSTASARPRCCTSSSPTGRTRCGTARPAGRCRATTSSCAARTDGAVPDGEPGDLYIHGPSAALMYWGNRAKTRETFQGGWTKSGDKYIRNADGSYTYAGRSRRHAEGRRRLGEPVRGRGDAGAAPVRPGGRGHRRARRRRPHQDQGLRRPEDGRAARPTPSSSTSSRTASPRTNTRARSSSSPNCPRPRPARSSASDSGRWSASANDRACDAAPRLDHLLLSDGPAGLQTFMVVRHHQIDFASGALVFPGGRLEAADAELAASLDGAPTRSPRSRSPRSARRSRNAASSSRDRMAATRSFRPSARKPRPRRALRRALGPRRPRAGNRPARPLHPLDHARLRTEALRHMVLPGARAARPGARPRRAEAVDSIWLAPREALAEHGKRFKLLFPTERNLWKLAAHADAASALAAARAGAIVTVLPETSRDRRRPGPRNPGRGRLRRRGVFGARAAVAGYPLSSRVASGDRVPCLYPDSLRSRETP